MRTNRVLRRGFVISLLLIFAVCLLLKSTANANADETEQDSRTNLTLLSTSNANDAEQESKANLTQQPASDARKKDSKVVRVGWYDSTYCFRDQYGERRGVAYEYQQRIAAHTGWKYEYVEESWPNLLQMLINGEIDLLSDVSYTKERSHLMLYSYQPMGAESYYLYIDAANTQISSEDLQTLDEKRVGVNKGSYQAGLLRDWAARNGISLEIVELTDKEPDSVGMLTNGEFDAYVSLDSFGVQDKIVPVCKIGASDYYFAVNKDRPDLLNELNNAMSAILDEDPYFNQRLFDQYVQLTKTNAFLPQRLEDWLKNHGTIRVGYPDNYLPFCASDKTTGELTGALKAYLAHAANCLKNANISFEAVPCSGIDALLGALQRGEVDCIFPVNISTYNGEMMGLLLTNHVMKTEMSVLMRAEGRPEITSESRLTVAIVERNINYETFIREVFPEWTIKKYSSVEECFQATGSREADAVLASNHLTSEYNPLLSKYKLVDLPTGETMGFSFAVSSDKPELYAILNKIANLSSSEDMEYALASYMYLNQKVSFLDFLRDNWIGVILVISAVFILFVILLLQKMKAERKAGEQQRLLEKAAAIEDLTQTITSLLDNMPGMNFTKEAKTGAYLACNQAFAEHAGQKKPEDVIGRTDAEIFDAETAKRLVAEDKLALSMDEPYIFFEDVHDASGNRRHIKTTKQKYTDATGRLCVLGISLDVTTDTFRIHRDTATTREAYEKARGTGIIYAHIAQALARGYTNLYYVDLNTEQFIEYHTDADGGLAEARRGWHFFEECQEEAEERVYSEDREGVQKALDRKTLVAALDRNNTFSMTYRLNKAKGPTYVSMTVTRMQDDDRFVILGLTDIDEQMKQRNVAMRMQEEKIAYERLRVLTGDILCIYLVDPETGWYREFNPTEDFVSFAHPTEGQDFFADCREQSGGVVYPEDRSRFLTMLTRENVLPDVENHGIFTLSYRLMLGGRPCYVQLKAALLEEQGGRRLVIGVIDIDKQVRREEEYVKTLAQVQKEVSIDTLTGVKNRHAFLVAEERLNVQLAENRAPAFAIVSLDVNDLKKVNDNEGHKAGDQYLRDACKIICTTFKHSPVYRVGGDEFVVISQGEDYEHLEELVGRMSDHNTEAMQSGGIVIACGMARCENDDTNVSQVFERADRLMYENKYDLKKRQALQ